MDMWETFGHEKNKRILALQVEANVFPHAYLFAGPEGIGKKVLAEELARKILGAERLRNHPDFSLLDAEGEIGIEQLHNFLTQLSYKPLMGSKKVAIINNVQNLNTSSGNALLKTLEEPSQSTIIILISSSLALMPTIVSRCQMFTFSAFTGNQLAQYATENNLKISEEVIKLSFGRINRLTRLVQDPKFIKEQQEIISKLKQLQNFSKAEKILAIQSIAEQEPEDLEASLLSWLYWVRAELGNNPKWYYILKALLSALNGLRTNQNKKLILQQLVLAL